MQDPKEKEKWFPLIPSYQMHNYSDIQGEIKIQTTLYEQVSELKYFPGMLKGTMTLGARLRDLRRIIDNNYSPKWRWLVHGGYLPSHEILVRTKTVS